MGLTRCERRAFIVRPRTDGLRAGRSRNGQWRIQTTAENGRRRGDQILRDALRAVHALDKVSLEVREGEFLCILGPSGCGKSTLLWSMAGLHDLTDGQIRLGKEVIIQPHPEIAVIFQDANLLPWRNLLKNVALPFELKGADRTWSGSSVCSSGSISKGFETQVPARTIGRHAAARLDRQEPRGQSVRPADGRALRRARRLHPRRDESADSGNLDGDRQDDRLRHPLDFRGDLPCRPRRRHVGAAGPHLGDLRHRHSAAPTGRDPDAAAISSPACSRSRRESIVVAARVGLAIA